MSKTAKIIISNDSDKPLLISLEPWGEDYTLRQDEQVEIIAEDCEQDFYYHIGYQNNILSNFNIVSVYAEGKGNEYPRVYSKGVELECGYNRNLSPI